MRPRLTDEDILNAPKVTVQMAADYLGIDAMTIRLDLRDGIAKYGTATKRGARWNYKIVPRRLVAYNNGRMLESELADVMAQMESLKRQMSRLQGEIKKRS